jgi:hypothetical protein
VDKDCCYKSLIVYVWKVELWWPQRLKDFCFYVLKIFLKKFEIFLFFYLFQINFF